MEAFSPSGCPLEACSRGGTPLIQQASCTGGPFWPDLGHSEEHQTGGIILRIVVLGGGHVGSAIVRDLAAEDGFSVLGVDLDPVRVERMTEFGADGVVADLSELANVSKAIADADLVVGAVPGFMGYQTVERVLQEGKELGSKGV